MMTPHKNGRATNFALTIHHLSSDIVSGHSFVPSTSEELKAAIADEVRAQMVPVVKEIVHEVVHEMRNVLTEMVTPLYDEFRGLRSHTLISNNLLYSMGGSTGIYVTGPYTYQNDDAQDGQVNKVENCDESSLSSSSIKRSTVYARNNFSSRNQSEFVREPREPRAQSSTSDCAAFSFIYYNTACLIPISTLLDPENNAFVCQKVPKIFLGKEGGRISFLVDMKTVRLRDLTSDNLGYWTSRFAAHMKTRKYFVKDGEITGRIRQFGQICHLLQDYDYILHRQYYCHGNTIGPAAIRKNIWYLTSKVHGGQVVGCALISYEIGDNATVKVSKIRYKSSTVELKKEVPAEEMTVSVVVSQNGEFQRFMESMKPL